MKFEKFDEFAGKLVYFYGVDRFTLCVRPIHNSPQRLAFEAVEDPDDGYRSMLKDIPRVPLTGHIFFRQPIARVRIEEDTALEGYRLIDTKDGHVWLRFGTDRSDDWYPMFTFDYRPREAKR